MEFTHLCTNVRALKLNRRKSPKRTMAVLSLKQVLEDKQARDPNAITALVLNHKALSNVYCLSEFKNLERLDLSANSLTSLEDLKSCVNLKWLSVVQNKLQSLKGIEGLTNLTVLNAGKNKIKSVDEIRSLVSLRALILNDNEIVSICRLDRMKELNTLVLSRNPIGKIDEFLFKVNSITKLSLSNCQLQTINSVKSCTELKELRLAHNDIKTLPSELVHNSKLRLLDVGNNLITSWSDIKVLSSLANLKNLNMQGNPIAENVKLAEKIRRRLPNLQILNARPVDKLAKNEKGDRDERVDDSSLHVANRQGSRGEEEKDVSMRHKNPKQYAIGQKTPNSDDQHDTVGDVERGRGFKKQSQKTVVVMKEKNLGQYEDSAVTDKKLKKTFKKMEEHKVGIPGIQLTGPPVKKELKRKKDKASQIEKAEAPSHKDDSTVTDKELKIKSKKLKQNEVNVIDDGETPFSELFHDTGENAEDDKAIRSVKTIDNLVTFPPKRKKMKSRGKVSAVQLSLVAEVGLGGPSTWDD
ncbi:plant intracellular Ras-group-related LRR protein 9 [Diospyros lotus]|uniref:plant intracellular Ras-group-related LRR protein 9 n=1 Tax=Diospyros lotus TaxID=55363 RepID=UPI00225A4C5D|nr:plant intracellular Ras-group-related LRR protein 9 [Diospyros lotus]